jgi:hypothetical protein
MTTSSQLAAAAFALVMLTFLVGVRLLYVRSREMKAKRVHPQAAATSVQMAAKLQDVQAADNFRNLFETPVLFYALIAVAIGSGHMPGWLVVGAWCYVALRAVHSYIHCTYNKVMQRFAVFVSGFLLLVGLWAAFVATLAAKSAA